MPEDAGIWLMRHGAVDDHWQRRLLGRLDVPLSAAGERQVRRAARALWQDAPCARQPSLLVVSPLWRCRRSAEVLRETLEPLAARMLPVRVEEGLTEIALGAWDGLPAAEIRQRYPRQWAARGRDPARQAPPGGESFAAVQQRVLAVVRHLVQAGTMAADVPLLLCHAGVIRALLAGAMALPLEQVLRLSVPYAARVWLPLSALPPC